MTPILASRCALHSAARAAQWWQSHPYCRRLSRVGAVACSLAPWLGSTRCGRQAEVPMSRCDATQCDAGTGPDSRIGLWPHDRIALEVPKCKGEGGRGAPSFSPIVFAWIVCKHTPPPPPAHAHTHTQTNTHTHTRTRTHSHSRARQRRKLRATSFIVLSEAMKPRSCIHLCFF